MFIDYWLKRQHLTESQRAAIAADIANLQHGTNRYQEKVDPSIEGSTLSTTEAAEMLKVGRATVERAKAVKTNFPEAWEHVKTVRLQSPMPKD